MRNFNIQFLQGVEIHTSNMLRLVHGHSHLNLLSHAAELANFRVTNCDIHCLGVKAWKGGDNMGH